MIHTRKSFAKICGITEQQVAVYVSRNKIVEINKKIDDTLPENIDFMENKQAKGGATHVELKVKPRAMTAKEKDAYDLRIEEAARIRKLNSGLTQRKQERLTEEIELLKIKRQKIEGFFIPTDLVKMLLSQEFKQFIVSFHQGADILIMEISKKKS